MGIFFYFDNNSKNIFKYFIFKYENYPKISLLDTLQGSI